VVATQQLLADRAARETLRQNARAEAERWSWAAATQQLTGFYAQMLAPGHDRGLAAANRDRALAPP
jgi:hypothetical protein